ncbi:MAG: cyclic nucleotide-binding domain-containing protein [Chitinophagales bacterium]|nr:cyclic nucleotide-binding domain-containing protein [Chitinophagales bacterium]
MTNPENKKLLMIEKVLLLKSLSIFSETPETILAEIAHLTNEEPIKEGEIIFNEGEAGSCMYIIYSGKIEIRKGNQLLVEMGEKDFFGELSLLDTEARSASAIAKTECMLLRIDQDPFYELMELQPDVVKGVIRILCKRIRAVNQKLFEVASK